MYHAVFLTGGKYEINIIADIHSFGSIGWADLLVCNNVADEPLYLIAPSGFACSVVAKLKQNSTQKFSKGELQAIAELVAVYHADLDDLDAILFINHRNQITIIH